MQFLPHHPPFPQLLSSILQPEQIAKASYLTLTIIVISHIGKKADTRGHHTQALHYTMATQPLTSLPLRFDGPPATPPSDSHRTATASDKGNIPVDTNQITARYRKVSPAHDGAASPPAFVRPATPLTPAEPREALLSDPPTSRLPTAHIINATRPPSYNQTTGGHAIPAIVKLRTAVIHWLYLVWLDILFLVITALFMGAIYLWAPLFRWRERLFPVVWDSNYEVWQGPVALSYGQEPFVISTLTAGLVVNLVPTAVLYGLQFWVCTPSLGNLPDWITHLRVPVY